MSNLARMELSPDVRESIQASLPKGQVIRHVVLVFEMGSFNEYFLVATDSLIATRGLKWDWDLSAKQLQAKEKLEKSSSFLTKGLKWVDRNLDKNRDDNLLGGAVERAEEQLDQKIIGLVAAKHGPLNIKWLPQILWSKDFLISEFNFSFYQEQPTFNEAAKAFAGRGHQTEQIAEVEYSIGDTRGWMWSFFTDLRDIYEHLRDRKLEGSTPTKPGNVTTKCQSCGSTELTVRDTHLVCDYCQSKYAR